MERYVASLLGSAALALVGIPGAQAASVPIINPQGCQIPAACIDLNNAMQGSVNPAVPGFGALLFGKNYIDNGDMFMHARGTGTFTGATSGGCAVTNYVADRWCVMDVTGGTEVVNSAVSTVPTPPIGFQNAMAVWRNSGTAVSQVCAYQEIESARAVQLQGKPAILSAYLEALSGAPTSVTITGTVFIGTGTDQGLGQLRSSTGLINATSLYPNWTGVSILPIALVAQPPAGSFSRFSSGQIPIPTSETEIGVNFCFTPGSEAAGGTDGFAFTGVQFELADPNQTTASQFEFVPPFIDQQRSQRYYQQITEQTGLAIAVGTNYAAASQLAMVTLATPMQAQPVVTFTAGGWSWVFSSVARTAVSGLFVASSVLSMVTTTGGLMIQDSLTSTINLIAVLIGTSATGKMVISADF